MRVLLGFNHIGCQALSLQRPQGLRGRQLSVENDQVKGPGPEYRLRDG